MTLTYGVGSSPKLKDFLIREYPYIAYCLSFIDVIDTDEINTAAVDGANIFVNPEYIDSLTFRESVAVVAHETLHIAFEHIRRFKEFEDTDLWSDRIGLWNLAGDIWINFILYRNGLHEIVGLGVDYNDYNIQPSYLASMSVEEIYQYLIERGVTHRTYDLDIQYPVYSGIDWNSIRKDANQFQHTAGSKMYGLSESDKGLWRKAVIEILNNYVKMKTISDYSSLNRRFPEGVFGTIIPGEKKNPADESLVLVLDISGSMVSNILTKEDVSFIISEIEKRKIKVDILFHDEEVYDSEQNGSKRSTFFCPVIDYIKEKYENPVVLWRTDGDYQDNPEFPSNFNFIWLLTKRMKDKKLPGKHFII